MNSKNWRYTIGVADLNECFGNGQLTLKAVCSAFAKRIKLHTLTKTENEMLDWALWFEWLAWNEPTEAKYDSLMAVFYEFADSVSLFVV